MNWRFAGRSCRGPLWPVGLLHGGGDTPVAHAALPGDGHPEAGGDDRGAVPGRAAALG